MLANYHVAVLTEALGQYFSPGALQEIVAANLGQDSPFNLLRSVIHFDNSLITEGLAYIEEQHSLIARAEDPHVMRAAFGRLSHTAQDFYSHSNYVGLWLKANGGLENSRPEGINGADPASLNSPDLRSGYFYMWRDWIYYIPLLANVTRKYLVFPNSHEAMHLDSPDRGPRFPYSIVAAKQRTLAEHHRAVQNLSAARARLFHGL